MLRGGRGAVHPASAAIDVDDFTDALDAMVTIQNEVLTEPRVLFWDGSGSVTAGCRFGGTLRVSLGFAGEKVVFNDCEMADGMVFSGTGDYDFASGRVALDITFDGGSLTYASGPDGSLTGTFRGRPVDVGD